MSTEILKKQTYTLEVDPEKINWILNTYRENLITLNLFSKDGTV